MDRIYSTLVPDASASMRISISKTLELFGMPVLNFVASKGVTIRPLRNKERYDAASPALKRLRIDIDAWPASPAGLFVVEERTVYLRSKSPMTVAHEFGHGLDCALGNGSYHSSTDPKLRSLFSNAQSFVTPYAATGSDEYFAESMRAFIEANDTRSFWPLATNERLRMVDPAMWNYLAALCAGS